jgi:hypothetical protein
MLVTRSNREWVIAVHRFLEVSIGIAVGLAITALWPEHLTGAAAVASRPNVKGTRINPVAELGDTLNSTGVYLSSSL